MVAFGPNGMVTWDIQSPLSSTLSSETCNAYEVYINIHGFTSTNKFFLLFQQQFSISFINENLTLPMCPWLLLSWQWLQMFYPLRFGL